MPTYHRALCLDTSWVSYLQQHRICDGGPSAGAAIAATQASLGGCQAARHSATRAILFQGASEGLELITLDTGLGLVPFSIDVHASQLGTLTRLVHAVELGLVKEHLVNHANFLSQPCPRAAQQPTNDHRGYPNP